jgi:DMSO/TMAO reductase YedYZ molybdopterin-dependent catalytic subunit
MPIFDAGRRLSRRHFLRRLMGTARSSQPVASPLQDLITFDTPIITPVRQNIQSQGSAAYAPVVDVDSWMLKVDGLVEQPLTLAYDEVRLLPDFGEVRTLVSPPDNPEGQMVYNGVWRGCRLDDLLNLVGIRSRAKFIQFEAVDGGGCEFPVDHESLSQTLLAYELNGAPLPPAQGFPVRIVVPGFYDTMSLRWLSRITLRNNDGAGRLHYATERTTIKTLSRIMTPLSYSEIRKGSETAIQGIAFAGLNRIAAVELSIDNGPWMPATIRHPDSPHAWTQWYTSWTPEIAGAYGVRVRAIDELGIVGNADADDRAAATGLHSIVLLVVA